MPILDQRNYEQSIQNSFITGASQGIGAGIVRVFLASGYDVVGTARNATKSSELSASDHLALIDGDIGQFETAQKVAELAIKKFGSIDAVVANEGARQIRVILHSKKLITATWYRSGQKSAHGGPANAQPA